MSACFLKHLRSRDLLTAAGLTFSPLFPPIRRGNRGEFDASCSAPLQSSRFAEINANMSKNAKEATLKRRKVSGGGAECFAVFFFFSFFLGPSIAPANHAFFVLDYREIGFSDVRTCVRCGAGGWQRQERAEAQLRETKQDVDHWRSKAPRTRAKGPRGAAKRPLPRELLAAELAGELGGLRNQPNGG